jgi:predicted ATPase
MRSLARLWFLKDMPIQSISVTNFRGIGDNTTIPIKPITIFVGANSSGKSTVIHALAALSQTVKASNDSRPLILDDDYAYVHLGRFIEVIHSKKYTDAITFGLAIDKFQFVELVKEKPEHKTGDLNVSYSFKSTTRTQKVSVECGNISIGQTAYEIKRKGEEYVVKNMSSGKSATTTFKTGFTLDEAGLFGGGPEMLTNFWPALMAQRHTNELLQKTLYLGPFRLPHCDNTQREEQHHLKSARKVKQL